VDFLNWSSALVLPIFWCVLARCPVVKAVFHSIRPNTTEAVLGLQVVVLQGEVAGGLFFRVLFPLTQHYVLSTSQHRHIVSFVSTTERAT